MSSIAKEIEEAAALRQRIEEEREKGEEYEEAFRSVYYPLHDVIGGYSDLTLYWVDYMDSIKELGIDDEKVARVYEQIKKGTIDGKLFGNFASKEEAYEKAREKLINKIENAPDEDKKVKAKEELEKFEKALDIISNATIQERMYCCANNGWSRRNYEGDMKDFFDLAFQKYSKALLDSYADKLRFYDEYINIIKFNKKLESMSDEEIKKLYISTLNSNKQIETIEQEIANLESEKEELTNQLEKKKREEEAKLPSIEEIEKQIKTDEIQLKKVYDSLVFMGVDPEQNQKYITKKEELDKRKKNKHNPKQAVEFLPEIIELKDKINKINAQIQTQNSKKEVIIDGSEQKHVEEMSREEIENKLREMSGLDFKTLKLLEITKAEYLSFGDSSYEDILQAADKTLARIEKDISDEENKINNYKAEISRIPDDIEYHKNHLKTLANEKESLEVQQKQLNALLNDGKIEFYINYEDYLTNGIPDSTKAKLTDEELKTFSEVLKLNNLYHEAETTFPKECGFESLSDFENEEYYARVRKEENESNKKKLKTVDSIIDKVDLKRQIVSYEHKRQKKDNFIIERKEEIGRRLNSYRTAVEKMRELIAKNVKREYPEAYEAYNNTIGRDIYFDCQAGNINSYKNQLQKINNSLNSNEEEQIRYKNGLTFLNDKLENLPIEISKSEEKISQLNEEREVIISYKEKGGLFPRKEARRLYNQLNPDELDINSPTYESEFNQQLGIEEETTGKTK